MNVLIIYDSQYGNTKEIAGAIAGVIKRRHTVRLVSADRAKKADLGNADLLIVGSPTQGGAPTHKIHDFLKTLDYNSLAGVKAASFDTRVSSPLVRLFGFAAGRIARELKAAGGTLIVAPHGFYVGGKIGPMKPGELDRVCRWADDILEKCRAEDARVAQELEILVTQKNEEPVEFLRSPQD